MIRETAQTRSKAIFDGENLDDGLLVAPSLVGELIDSIFDDVEAEKQQRIELCQAAIAEHNWSNFNEYIKVQCHAIGLRMDGVLRRYGLGQHIASWESFLKGQNKLTGEVGLKIREVLDAEGIDYMSHPKVKIDKLD